MIHYWAAMQRPFKKTLMILIGTVCYMIPIMNLLTGPFSNGYILDISKRLFKKSKQPLWEDWERMWINGLLASIISLFYFLPAFIFIFIALQEQTIITLISIFMEGNIWVLYNIETLLAVIVSTISLFLIPMAILHYTNKEFKDAFNIIKILQLSLNRTYIVAWITASFYSFLLFSIWLIFSILVLTSISNPALFPHAFVLIFVLFGFVNWIQKMTRISSLAECYAKLILPEK